MYISRDIDTALKEWKDSNNRKPLLLRGVRQCGKTSAVRHLGEKFVSYVELNFDKKPSLYRIFEGDLDVNTIISRIEIEMSISVNDGETLLFIDEIQACPRAISALRYFYEDRPELHVIAAGSLLEFVFGKKDGEEFDFPVGRVRSLFMYPFSFREFLKGIGNEQLLNSIAVQINDCVLERDAGLSKSTVNDSFLSLIGYAWNKLYRKKSLTDLLLLLEDKPV